MNTFRQKLFVPVYFLLIFYAPVWAASPEQASYARLLQTGSEQLKEGDYDGAKESFAEALKYQDNHPAAHFGLGVAYFHLGDDFYAERELSQAAVLDPGLSEAHLWLGEISYRRDDLESAVLHWEKAVELNPSNGNVRARLERIRKEHVAEKDFNREVTSHFLVKYEGREKIEAGRIVLRILEDAYSELGRHFQFYPDREIQVILYSDRQFREVTDAPDWSGAVYDGRIRLPIGGVEKETPGLRKLLYHEYAHAVIRAVSPQCPAWLNEGLAQYAEGREIDSYQKEMLKTAARQGKVPSLADLESSFSGFSGSEAAFAYLFSLSSVKYLIDNFGMYRVRTVLDELASGADTGRAIDRAILLSYDEFERGWKRSLE